MFVPLKLSLTFSLRTSEYNSKWLTKESIHYRQLQSAENSILPVKNFNFLFFGGLQIVTGVENVGWLVDLVRH